MKEYITISLRHPLTRVDIHPPVPVCPPQGPPPPLTFRSYEVPTEAAQALIKLGAVRTLQRLIKECRNPVAAHYLENMRGRIEHMTAEDVTLELR